MAVIHLVGGADAAAQSGSGSKVPAAAKAGKAGKGKTEPADPGASAKDKGKGGNKAGRRPASQGHPPPEEPTASEPVAQAEPVQGEPEPVRITGRVVYGSDSSPRRVAIVDIKRVFEHIPCYAEIRDGSLKKTKARYHFVMAQANEEFRTAVAQVAREGGFDVVVEEGGLENAGPSVIDLTDSVIQKVAAATADQ